MIPLFLDFFSNLLLLLFFKKDESAELSSSTSLRATKDRITLERTASESSGLFVRFQILIYY